MTSLLVFGDSYWAPRIARSIDDPVGGLTAEFIPQSRYGHVLARRWDAPLVLLRVGFRVGGTTRRARAFDAYWTILRRRFPSAAGAHYWLGSDVLNTLEEAAAGTLRTTVVASSRDDLHLAGAPWLAEELGSVGLRAATAPIPQTYDAQAAIPDLPSTFRVMTYLPGDRFDFYGGGAIFESARRLPDVSFQIVGEVGNHAEAIPANVEFLGWVGDMDPIYRNATVVLRLPRHDGFGGTVKEGLRQARHIVYTHPVPFCTQVWPVTAEAIVAALSVLRDAHNAGTLATNLGGRAWALKEFDERTLVNGLRSKIRALK